MLLWGAGLRLWGLDREGLWQDEGLTAALVRLPFSGIVDALRYDTGSPLLYFLLRIVPGTEQGEFWLRLPGALVSLAVLPLVFLIGRRVGGDRVGLWAMFLVAVSPLQVHYAREARFYPYLSLFAAGAALGLLLAGQRRGKGGLLLYLVSCLALLYLHNVGLFFVAACALVLAVRSDGRAGIWRVTSAHAVLALAYLPWLPVFLEQVRLTSKFVWWMRGFWEAYPPPLALYRTLEAYSLFPKTPAFVGLDFLPRLAPLCVAAFVLLIGYGLASREFRRRGGIDLALIVLLPLLGVFIYSFHQPIYLAGRTDSFLYPLFAVLVAAGLARLRAMSKRIDAVVAVGLLALSLGVQAHVLGSADVVADREAARWLDSAVASDDLIVLCGPEPVTIEYYLRRDRPEVRRKYLPASLGEVFRTLPFEHTAREAEQLTLEADSLERRARTELADDGTVWVVGVEGSLAASLLQLFAERGWQADERVYRFHTAKRYLRAAIVGLRRPPDEFGPSRMNR